MAHGSPEAGNHSDKMKGGPGACSEEWDGSLGGAEYRSIGGAQEVYKRSLV